MGYIVHTKSVVVFICIYLFAYIGLAFFNLMCWAMIIDVIDDIEVKKESAATVRFIPSIPSQGSSDRQQPTV